MRVTFRPHHPLVYRYGLAYAHALQAAGHELVDDAGDVLLTDLDCAKWLPWKHQLPVHDRTVLYPHHAGWAMPYPRHPSTVGQFVTAPGHVTVAERVGDPVPAVAAGWPWTHLKPFAPFTEDRPPNIFFAPSHPANDGYRTADNADAVQRRLHRMFPDAGWEISTTVHHLDDTAITVQNADLTVTSTSTVLAIAVALGRPAVFFGPPEQAHGSYDDVSRHTYTPPPAALELLAYPHRPKDVAAALTTEASDWRKQWVGEHFDAELVAEQFTKWTAA